MAKKTKCSPNMTYLLCLIIVGLIIYLIYTNLNFYNGSDKSRESFQENKFLSKDLQVNIEVAKNTIKSLIESLGKINNILVSSISNKHLKKIYKPVIDHAKKQDELLEEQIDKLKDIYGKKSKTLTASKASNAKKKDCLNKAKYFKNAQLYHCIDVI